MTFAVRKLIILWVFNRLQHIVLQQMLSYEPQDRTIQLQHQPSFIQHQKAVFEYSHREATLEWMIHQIKFNNEELFSFCSQFQVIAAKHGRILTTCCNILRMGLWEEIQYLFQYTNVLDTFSISSECVKTWKSRFNHIGQNRPQYRGR